MLLRLLLAFTLLLTWFGLSPQGSHALSIDPGDSRMLIRAGAALRHHDRSYVLHWLRHQEPVRSARLGSDGKTIAILFRDGTRGAVLPNQMQTVKFRLPVSRSEQQAPSSGRALVLEPFATQLGLGPNAGDPEVNALHT